MAFYIPLRKTSENEQTVTYEFNVDSNYGILALNKVTGEVQELKSLKTLNSNAFYQRAAIKVRQHWKEGHYPDKTQWAS